MLPLNLLTSSSVTPQSLSELRPRTKPVEEKHAGADFAAYLVALAPAQKMEISTAQPGTQREELRGERSATPVSDALSAQPQKAGADAPLGSEISTEKTETKQIVKEPAAERENTASAKSEKTSAAKPARELLEALGIDIRKNIATVAAAHKTAAAKSTTQTTTALPTQHIVLQRGDKSQLAVVALNHLQKTPDIFLANSDGLRRLGEKLGMGFLSKVSEKLNEKHVKRAATPSIHPQAEKVEAKPQAIAFKGQKAGEREQGFAPESQSKYAKQSPLKNVSRETALTPPAASPLPEGEALKVKSLANETGQTRTQTPASSEIRLSDAVSHTRHSEIQRTAMENHSLQGMRGELTRQLNEIITRANVLVADQQNAQFSVKLYPRELGRMEIDLKLVDGEIRGKIVVESEDVKNEMQNFLQKDNNQSGAEQFDMNRIDIEVRSGNQHAQQGARTPESAELLQNLVTRAATNVYDAPLATSAQGNAIYA